jgi:hypothetical protein
VRFKQELHGPFYYDHYDKFQPSEGLKYVERLVMPDGTYNGYMKTDERMGDVRHGPGTLVHPDG